MSLIYSASEGIEVPLTSIKLMRWWASMEVKLEINCLYAENRMTFFLTTEKQILLEKQLVPNVGDSLCIEKAEINLNSDSEQLLTSEFFTGLGEKEQDALHEILNKISRFTLKINASNTTMTQMSEVMAMEQLQKYEPYKSEEKVLRKRQRGLEKAYDALQEFVSAQNQVVYDRSKIPDARKWEEWSEEVESAYINILDPDSFLGDEPKSILSDNNSISNEALASLVPASDRMMGEFIASHPPSEIHEVAMEEADDAIPSE